MEFVQHPFEPIYDGNSRILILGSLPSVKSREQNFYYMHSQNRFWKLMADLADVPFPESIESKKKFLLQRGIALWDVIASCEIEKSMDNSIQNPVANDFSILFSRSNIQMVFTNGKKSDQLYNKLVFPKTGRPAICLPSTSPANASYDMQRLRKAWRVILPYLRRDI